MISWETYFERIVKLRIQFDLARKALDGFTGSQEALDRYANEEFEGARKLILEAAKKEGTDEKETWANDKNRVQRYLELSKSHALSGMGDVKIRLSQNEYILQAAIFESFMKSVHREILRAAPTLLRSDRNIDLGRLVSQGQETLVREEIEREVQSLDRQSVEKKAEYFRDRLNIDWFGGKIVPLLDLAINVRNEILH